MTFIRVLNEDLTSIVIDDDFYNLAHIAKGSGTFTAFNAIYTNAGTGRAFVTVTDATAPFIALLGRDGAVAGVAPSGRSTNGTGSFTFTIYGPIDDTFSYWIFDRPKGASLDGISFKTRDALGNIVWNAAEKYMAVVSSADIPDIRSGAGSVVVPAGKTYAVLYTKTARFSAYVPKAPIGGYVFVSYAAASLRSGATITFGAKNVEYYDKTGGAQKSGTFGSTDASLLVIDVTNL